MQVFRLIQGGKPDRVLAFDSLPKELVATLKTSGPNGLPRHWGKWLKETGSVDKSGNPVFYLCDYLSVNNDREAWENINSFVRKAVETSVRLRDKLEDMGVYMSKDSRSDMELEPEDVAIIAVPAQEPVLAGAGPTLEEAPVAKKRGRPVKISQEA